MLYTFEFLVALIAILGVAFGLWAYMWQDEVKCLKRQRELLKQSIALNPIQFSALRQHNVINFDDINQQTSESQKQENTGYSIGYF